MPEVIISDTSCLLVFTNAGRLVLLKELYREVLVTSVIKAEYRLPLPDWIHVADPSDVECATRLSSLVDAGEASALALALERTDAKLILDDLKGRRLAIELGIPVTGSLGVLKAAKDKALISAMAPVLDDLRKAGLWLSDELVRAVLAEAGEGEWNNG
jgi:predicted nucleic acid-binding protein